jgi:hypothetical protein
MSITIDGKEYYGIIYKIENTITHNVYIGQTTHPKGFNGRYYYKGVGIERVYHDLSSKRDRNERYNRHLLRSIEKCGFDAFVVDELLDMALTIEELNEKETYYIKKFDSYRNGYNMSFGGDGVSGYHRPSGKDCPNSKRVCQISLDGDLIKMWDCASDVQRELGINQTTICAVCSGKRKTAGGFVWVHEKDYDPNNDYKRVPQIKDRGKGTRPVLLLSDDDEVIQEFYSVINAGQTLGIKPQEVSRICLHKAKTIKYNLVYKSEYIGEQRLSEKGLAI